MQFLESIAVFQRKYKSLPYHQARVDRSRKEVLGLEDPFTLADLLKIPDSLGQTLYKCRLIYDRKLLGVDYIPYFPKSLNSLRLIELDEIEYTYKYADRQIWESLQKQKAGADDILVVKKGRVTDISYANIAFWDGEKWLTPAEPLLKGTKSAALLDNGLIEADDIKVQDLSKFKKARPLNALLDFETVSAIDIKNIHF